jgi:RimJ/RimL family protein N-acetyltransferase
VETNEHGQRVGAVVPGWSPRDLPQRVDLPGRYVTAEPLHPRHSEALFAALCGPDDDALWTYRPQRRPRSAAEMDEVVVRPLAGDPGSSGGTTYAFVPTGGEAAGFASFFPCAPLHGVVEISGVLWGRRLQRSTAATEAVHLMVGYAFERLGYRRVEWKCDSLNEPSRRAAARFGFTYEGRFRQHMVTKDRNRDTDWFSMLDSEWPAIRARNERWLDPGNFDGSGTQRRSLTELS